ncbi:MAG TPA: alpha/beta fold hydrolase [Stellaceae bacterium]|nr:alpha/beta fold hydrolase [Stellaceae bacterium]
MSKGAMRWLFCLTVLLVLASASRAAEPVSFAASDGVRVFADYYPASSKAQPLILLCHQAGSNRGEYAPIAPVLVNLGYNALALDQRSGGSMWGQTNETVQHLGHSTGYDGVLTDMDGALQWARANGLTGPIIVWGSSYSAALAFVFAAKHPQDVKAILAFSPGEYLNGTSVRDAAAHLTMPIFVTSAKAPDEIVNAKAILDAAPAAIKVQFVPRIAGVHGSSTLRIDRNPTGADENWMAVKEFLGGLHL